ncbi:molybdenum cofactor guanylyltransferase [Actinospongicola halichondriae]|uniref:molybdenum cofactor guanylyltransferase n=1 Tax=Actinospongicola halichondriae TaxID=3236844 RepID=UPI003D4D8BC2
MSATSAFDGAVLCGGASRRMGSDKALVTVDGVAMACRVAHALQEAGAGNVVAVGGDHVALGELGLDLVADRWPGEGPLGGVISALRAPGPQDLVAVLSCDLLDPDPAAVRRLVASLSETGVDGVFPRVDGRPQWTHGVWRRRVAGVLEAIFSSGERSVYGAVHGLEIGFVDEGDRRPFDDADHPSDLPDRP